MTDSSASRPPVAQNPSMLRLWAEFALFYLGIPVALYVHPTRLLVAASLWAMAGYAVATLSCMPGFSWKKEWQGEGWPMPARRRALPMFAAATAAVTLLTAYLAPSRLLAFPLQRPGFWFAVMLLYPLLSALPQELVYRSLLFRRYARLWPCRHGFILASAFSFAFAHLLFSNWVAPSLSLAAGFIFAANYTAHRSLKWVVIEHAFYGCMLFTVGAGAYFVLGHRP